MNFRVVVIAGMPKTGTTLPLTLLDSHPDLLVFPEELRFFHLRGDRPNGKRAADVLLSDYNVRLLSKKRLYFPPDDYLRHVGTGFGKRDYSAFDFAQFEREVRHGFESTRDPGARFAGLVRAFNMGLGRPPLTSETIFVTKAPHNELYIKKWEKMLGDSAKYILCTRIPTEHFLSVKNVSALSRKLKSRNAPEYVNWVKSRLKHWNHFPKNRTFILGYDKLTGDTRNTLGQLCEFIGIDFDEILLKPTKMGVPWAGNSSRHIVKEGVFKNRHLAFQQLDEEEFEMIEYGLSDLYAFRQWELRTQIDAKRRMKYAIQILAARLNPKHLMKRIMRELKARLKG